MAAQTTADVAPLGGCTAFQRDLLAIIAGFDDEETCYGLAIKDRIDDAWGEEINHGRLYPNLDTIVEKGLVEKEPLDDRTNTYTLTRRGRRELDSHCAWFAEQLNE